MLCYTLLRREYLKIKISTQKKNNNKKTGKYYWPAPQINEWKLCSAEVFSSEAVQCFPCGWLGLFRGTKTVFFYVSFDFREETKKWHGAKSGLKVGKEWYSCLIIVYTPWLVNLILWGLLHAIQSQERCYFVELSRLVMFPTWILRISFFTDSNPMTEGA